MLKQRLSKLSEEQVKIMDELFELGQKYDHYDLMIAFQLKADLYKATLMYKDSGLSPEEFLNDIQSGVI